VVGDTQTMIRKGRKSQKYSYLVDLPTAEGGRKRIAWRQGRGFALIRPRRILGLYRDHDGDGLALPISMAHFQIADFLDPKSKRMHCAVPWPFAWCANPGVNGLCEKGIRSARFRWWPCGNLRGASNGGRCGERRQQALGVVISLPFSRRCHSTSLSSCQGVGSLLGEGRGEFSQVVFVLGGEKSWLDVSRSREGKYQLRIVGWTFYAFQPP
jgi:hypothetical protein